jgi:hypothetical protein
MEQQTVTISKVLLLSSLFHIHTSFSIQEVLDKSKCVILTGWYTRFT